MHCMHTYRCGKYIILSIIISKRPKITLRYDLHGEWASIFDRHKWHPIAGLQFCSW